MKSMILFAVSLVLIAGVELPAQAPQPDQHQHGQAPAPAADEQMKMRHEMLARMSAKGERLQALTAKMNEAKGQAKVSVMAEVVTLLVDERVALHRQMMQMMNGMAPAAAPAAPVEKAQETNEGKGCCKK